MSRHSHFCALFEWKAVMFFICCYVPIPNSRVAIAVAERSSRNSFPLPLFMITSNTTYTRSGGCSCLNGESLGLTWPFGTCGSCDLFWRPESLIGWGGGCFVRCRFDLGSYLIRDPMASVRTIAV